MAHYRIIEIKNTEPLKIGAKGFQSTYSEPTKEYVPGSTLRGALIGQLIRQGLFNEETKADFLLNMECYNAYPYYDHKIYLPKPLHLRVDKHNWRKKKVNRECEGKVELNNLLNDDKNKEIKNKNHLEYSFLAVDVNNIVDVFRGIKVPKEYRLHHSTQKKQAEKERENLFRYQAISPNQFFRGIIKYKDELEESIDKLLKGELTLYLGGSKGSGYGKCSVNCIVGPIKDYSEAKRVLGMDAFISKDQADSNSFTITCLSDCVFRNEYGQPINHLPEYQLNQLTGKEFTLEGQFVLMGKTEGYNATWQARYPKETTVKAGSVFKYQTKETLSYEEIQQITNTLEANPIGERIQDGYGWVGINMKYPNEMMIEEVRTISKDNRNKTESIELKDILKDEDTAKAFQIFTRGLKTAKYRWLQLLSIRLQGNGELKIDTKRLRKHQLKNIEEILDQWKAAGKIADKSQGEKLNREYAQNKDLFSLMGFDLAHLCIYFNNQIDKANDIEIKKDLDTFAEKKLNSQKGSLFYQSEQENPEKEFIYDLLKAALEIKRMEGRKNDSKME